SAIHDGPFGVCSSALAIEHDRLPANDIPAGAVDAVIATLDTARWEPALTLESVCSETVVTGGTIPNLGWAGVLAALLTGEASIQRSKKKSPCLRQPR